MRRALWLLAPLALFVLGPGLAQGERAQRGDLIVSLDGGLAPLKLPRDRAVPVAVRLEGGLRTDDRSPLPRVTRIELGLPGRAIISTRGLPICPQRLLRNAKPAEARVTCGAALIGHGVLEAQISVPSQDPFLLRARMLAFNGRVGGHRAVLLHAFTSNPPTVAVVPFLIRAGSGRFGTSLTANLSRALGPWPRFARFEMTLSRRYLFRGKPRSYLSASCPIPPRLTAGFFSLARVSLSLADGRRLGTGIARSCRAR
jgi:hypothetical protein